LLNRLGELGLHDQVLLAQLIHLLSEDVSVYHAIGRQGLLLETIVAIIEISHEVTVIVID
jgi:hypothetical protein